MNLHSSKLKKINHLLFESVIKILRTWRLKQYILNKRKPWSKGYREYKEIYLKNLLNDDSVLNLFRSSKNLPDNFGYRLDERVVE